MTTSAAAVPATPAVPTVHCPRCDNRIMDGEVLRCRVLRPGLVTSQAKCPRCKEWVCVPLRLA